MKKIASIEDYHKEYKKSIEQPETFWSEIAENFIWKRKWDSVLKWDFNNYNVNWFLNGKLNITENCLDRHLSSKGNQPAIMWEPNDPKEKALTLTYNELHEKVCNFANVLKNNGCKKGDRICIYMPWCLNLLLRFWLAQE